MPVKRLLIVTMALLCAVVLALAPAPRPASGTPTGLEFGAFSQPRSGESDQSAVLRGEATAGRKFDVVRTFINWDTPFPDDFETWLRDTGRTMILSVKSRRMNGTVIPWQSIIDSQPGSTLYAEIVGWADRIKAYGVPIYFTFNHEPESAASNTMGDAEQFIGAWRKIHDVFVARGVTNAKFMWIMTDYAFWVGDGARNWGPDWYPGDAYVDSMGIDAYNWYHCRTGINTAWKSLEQIVRPFRDFGAQHPDKELWLTEWASTEDPQNAARKPQWYADAQALFKRPEYAQFRGISYFDVKGQGTCQWYPDSSPASAAAYRTMATDPFYDGGVSPPASTVSFVASASSNGNYVNHAVQVPGAVRPGDTLLLFFTTNTVPTTTTPPTGWTQLRAATPSGGRSWVWTRAATASDAGSTVTIRSSSITKADLTVAAYRGTAASPVDVSAVNVQTTTTTQYVAPSVTPTRAGDWVVVYWADKSSTDAGHTIPAGLTRRRSTTGTGGGHITATVADTAAAVPASATGTSTATGTGPSSLAICYTIALRSP